jgi:hypothetical protein
MSRLDVHPAVRVVREGRYTMLVFEIDAATVGSSGTLHVIADGRAVCGRKGEIGEVVEGLDARALRVGPRLVCGNCRDRLGDVPSPKLAEDVEDGHSLGITRTELERERRRARKAAA